MMNPELESEERRKKTRYIGRHLAITFLWCLLLILLPYLFLQILKHRPYWWLAENKSFIEMEQICVEKIGDKYNGFYAESESQFLDSSNNQYAVDQKVCVLYGKSSSIENQCSNT